MKYLAILTTATMVAYTALSMAIQPNFTYLTVFSLGSISVSTFDLVFVTALALLLAHNAVHLRPDPVSANRYLLWLCAAYVIYQLAVVLPLAVVAHGIRPVDALRLVEVRLALIMVPTISSVVLRYWKPSTIIALVDVAAVGLVLWVLFRYFTVGGQGYWDGSVFRLRAVWGGATLLFAWLLFTSLFYWNTRFWRLALAGLALVGIVLANHRSGILALGAALAVQLAAMRGVTRRALLALVSFATVGVIVLMAAPSVRLNLEYSLSTMLNPNADATATDRVTHSTLAWAYFVQHPLGDYVWNQRYYLTNVSPDQNFVPHNFVVQMLVTQGIVPSAFYFAIIALSLAIGWRNRRDNLSSVMLAYLTFYLVMCLFNANIDLPENIALFFLPVALIVYQNRKLYLSRASRTAQGAVEAAEGAPAGHTLAPIKPSGGFGAVSETRS